MLSSEAHHSNMLTTPGSPRRRKVGRRATELRQGRTNGSWARSLGTCTGRGTARAHAVEAGGFGGSVRAAKLPRAAHDKACREEAQEPG